MVRLRVSNFDGPSCRYRFCSIALCVVFIAGCAETAEHPTETTHSDLFGQEIKGVLPILNGARDIPTEQRKVMFDREHSARSRCMAERGFTYIPRVYGGTPKSVRNPLDLEYASREGYGIVSPDSSDTSQVPPQQPDSVGNENLSESEMAAWDEAFLGSEDSSTQSCVDKAAESTYGTPDRDELVYEIEILVREIAAEIEADSGYRSAKDQWKKCIAPEGYSGVDSAEVAMAIKVESSEQKWTQEQIDEVQIRVATADVNCTKSSGWVNEWNRAVRAAESKRKSKIESILVSWKEINDPQRSL